MKTQIARHRPVISPENSLDLVQYFLNRIQSGSILIQLQENKETNQIHFTILGFNDALLVSLKIKKDTLGYGKIEDSIFKELFSHL